MSQALPFISYDAAQKRFVVDPQSVNLLSGLGSSPIAVLAVCGRARQGKSWLLNQLVQKLAPSKSQGFAVASTHRPCTKGLWLWSQPIQRVDPNTGRKYHLILVDCEGIDAFDQTLDYSTHVFSLGVLLSSIMVYNQLGSIDESSIDKLSNVCEFAKMIRDKSSKANASADADLSEMSPSFLWLLRDFHLQLADDKGRPLTPREYMEEVLTAGGQDRSKQQMRSSITSLFQKRDCFALVRPLSDEAQLANMDKLPLSSLRPEFKQGLDKLLELVLARAQPKSFRGSPITGSALAAFAQAYVGVINKGDVPLLSSTWQAVMSSENQRALDAAVAVYSRELEGGMTSTKGVAGVVNVDKLDEVHAAALNEALVTFGQQVLGSPVERAEWEVRLKAAVSKTWEPVRQTKLADADRRAVELLMQGAPRVTDPLSRDPPDLDAADAALAALLEKYDMQVSGPSKYKRAAEFVINTAMRGAVDAARRARKSTVDATAKAEAAQKQAAEAQAKVTDLTHRLKSAEHTLDVAQKQLTAAQAEAEKARQSGQQASTVAAREAAQKEVAQKEADELRNRVERLTNQLSAAQAAETAARASATAAQADAGRAGSDAADRARQLATLQAELDSMRASANSSAREAHARTSHAEAEAARLKAELTAAQSRQQVVEAEIARIKAEATSALAGKDSELAAARAEAASSGHHANVAVQQELAAVRGELAAAHALVSERDRTLAQLHEERSFLNRQIAELRTASAAKPSPPGFGGAAAAAVQAVGPGRNAFLFQDEEHVPAPPATVAKKRGAQRDDDSEDDNAAPEVDMEDAQEQEAAGTSKPARKRVKAMHHGAAGAKTPAAADGGAGPSAGAKTPFSDEKEVKVTGAKGKSAKKEVASKKGGSDGSGGGAEAELEALAKAKINDIKDWLTEHGHESDVFKLTQRRPAPKKEDWLALAREKAGLA